VARRIFSTGMSEIAMPRAAPSRHRLLHRPLPIEMAMAVLEVDGPLAHDQML